MKKSLLLLILLLIVGGGIFVAGQYHIVISNDGITAIPKSEFSFDDTFVDLRKWNLLTVAQHPDLTLKLIQSGHVDYLPGSREVANYINAEGIDNLKKTVNQGINTVNQLNERYKLSERGEEVGRKIQKIDEKYKIQEKTEKAGKYLEEKSSEIDKKYNVSKKAKKSLNKAKDLLGF